MTISDIQNESIDTDNQVDQAVSGIRPVSRDEFNDVLSAYTAKLCKADSANSSDIVSNRHPGKRLKVSDEALANRLTDETYKNVMSLMERTGNIILDDHKRALYLISEGLVRGSLTDEPFRWAYPLQTGMGKTSAVKAFIKSICDSNAQISLVIASEVIEQLKELKRDLLNLGISEDLIGIFHSSDDKHPDEPSINRREIRNTQILLVCHARLKNNDINFNDSLYFKDHERDLVIWDETLLSTKADFIPINKLISDCGAFINSFNWMVRQGKRPIHSDVAHKELYEFIMAVQGNILNNIHDEIVPLPQLREIDYDKIINSIHKSEYLKNLVKFSQSGMIRKVSTNEGPSYMQYYISVPDEIRKIVILDASSEVNKLLSYDKSIYLYNLDVMKDYSNCVIRFNNVQSSKSFLINKDGLNAYLNDLLNWVREELPRGEEAIVFCNADVFGMNVRTIITDAINDIGPGYNQRIHVLTWGSHKGINKYKDVKYVYTFGIIHRDRRDIAVSIIGQRRDLKHILIADEIQETQRSLQADLIYQAVSRGNCRNTNNGKAGEMFIYLNHSDDGIIGPDYLGKLMPNVRHEGYYSKFLKGGLVLYLDIAEKIVAFLDRLLNKVNKISISEVAKAIDYEDDTNSYTWRKALKHVTENIIGWERSKRSFTRSFECQDSSGMNVGIRELGD